MIDNSKEYIICAAIKRVEPRTDIQPYYAHENDMCSIEIGYRHHDIYQRFGNAVSPKMEDQGFYTSKGRFVNRIEAMEIAYNAGQVNERTALGRDWMKIELKSIEEGEPVRDEAYWKEHYPYKFNMLFSEDIY